MSGGGCGERRRLLRRRITTASLAATAALAALVSIWQVTNAAPPTKADTPLRGDPPALAVWNAGWKVWWRSDRAPTRWEGATPVVANAVQWRAAKAGVEWGTLRLSGSGEAHRLAIVLVRIDPRLVHFRLHATRTAAGEFRSWSISQSASSAAVAFNAGQFGVAGPWGWLIIRGVEEQSPGVGPLSSALVVDTAGGVRLVTAQEIPAVRRGGGVAEAFQSYPTLLDGDGDVPAALRAPDRGVSLAHRDARLAIGTLRDGRLLIALTRFDAFEGALSGLPFGPTVPETAAIMGALGARQAMLLDGGISGQLVVRDSLGGAQEWRGFRKVPLALVIESRGALH